jgi:hypothetical protein
VGGGVRHAKDERCGDEGKGEDENGAETLAAPVADDRTGTHWVAALHGKV